jgi:Myb/SANT-like DNA-binding domain
MEELLFYTLVKQVNIRKQADSRFKKEAWIACCTAINGTKIQPISIDKCKGKVDTMKRL